MTDNGLDFIFINIYIEIIGLTLITIPAQKKTDHTIKSIAFRERERVYWYMNAKIQDHIDLCNN